MTSRAWVSCERQKAVSFEFEGTRFEDAVRPDLINNDAVIVEVEAARALDPVLERQLLTCLKIMNLRLGLRMNFGMAHHGGWHPPHCQLKVHPCGPVRSVSLSANDVRSGGLLRWSPHL